MKKEYEEYLQSDHWKTASKNKKAEKKYRCEICHNRMLLEVHNLIDSPYHPNWQILDLVRFFELMDELKNKKRRLIQTHHKSYKNIGHERSEDLACLCIICHTFLTELSPNLGKARAWGATREKVNGIFSSIEYFRSRPVSKRRVDTIKRKFLGLIEKNPLEVYQSELLDEQVEEYFEWRKEFFDSIEDFN